MNEVWIPELLTSASLVRFLSLSRACSPPGSGKCWWQEVLGILKLRQLGCCHKKMLSAAKVPQWVSSHPQRCFQALGKTLPLAKTSVLSLQSHWSLTAGTCSISLKIPKTRPEVYLLAPADTHRPRLEMRSHCPPSSRGWALVQGSIDTGSRMGLLLFVQVLSIVLVIHGGEEAH